MKGKSYGRKFIFLLFLSAIFLFACFSASEAAEPEVVNVDFYPTGARFVFQLNLNEAGDFEFTLPVTFLPDSVRALQRGVASLRVETAQEEVPPDFLPALEPEERAAMEERRGILEGAAAEKRREIRLLAGRINAANHVLGMIHETFSLDASGVELLGHIDRVIELVDRKWEKRLQYELALAEHEIEIENARRQYGEILKELQTLRAELERDSLGRQAVPLVLRDVLRVRGTAPSAEPILFEARTNRAGWSVRYDINLNSENGDIDAVMFAMVNQATGLDLDGDFSFHSRTPTLAVTAPHLPPLTVRLRERIAERYRERMGGGQMSDAAWFNLAPSEQIALDLGVHALIAPEMIMQGREITATLANISIAGSGRIQGDGVVTSVELGQFEFSSTPLLIAIPEQNREAWIVARLDAVPDAFIPGPAALYIDGVTSGRTNIPELGLQETLPFGMAQRVSVEKRRSAGVTGTTWQGRTDTHGYTIDVTNNMDTEQEVEVRDRLPFPADERILLEDVEIYPAPELQDDENRLTWRMTLQPGETARISVEYTLRYPGDETLVYRW